VETIGLHHKQTTAHPQVLALVYGYELGIRLLYQQPEGLVQPVVVEGLRGEPQHHRVVGAAAADGALKLCQGIGADQQQGVQVALLNDTLGSTQGRKHLPVGFGVGWWGLS